MRDGKYNMPILMYFLVMLSVFITICFAILNKIGIISWGLFWIASPLWILNVVIILFLVFGYIYIIYIKKE